MVYDDRLGYDPDEWEECPEPEHFLVFSSFTRYLLTAAAIAFVYYFFKLLDEHKNGVKGGEEKEDVKTEEEEPQTKGQIGLNETSQFHSVKQQMQNIPNNAEELLREADEYLRDSTQTVIKSTQQQLIDNKFPSLEIDLNTGAPITSTNETFESALAAVDSHLYETKNMDLSPKSLDSTTQFEQIPSVHDEMAGYTHDFEHVPPHLKKAAEQYYQQQQQQQQAQQPQQQQYQQHAEQQFHNQQQNPLQFEQRPPVPQHVQQQHQQQQPQQQYNVAPISPTEQQLLQEFDIYDAPPGQGQQMAQLTDQLQQLGHQGQFRPIQGQDPQQHGDIHPFHPSPLHIQAQQQQQYGGQIDVSQLSPSARVRYEQSLIDPSQLSPTSRAQFGENTAFVPVAKKVGREKRLSEQDERALQDWEKEKALLEADRIKKLLDHEVGGDSGTDLSNSQKAYDHFAPASHISYESHSGDAHAAHIQPETPTAVKRIDKLSAPQQQNINNVRDSQLTDYDISDLNASHHEEPYYHQVMLNQQQQQQQQQHPQQYQQSQQQQSPRAIGEDRRRTTADSDDYVKVSEPIYDYPPKAAEPKRISPTEAAQLQELYQEYDLGLDIPGVKPIAQPRNVPPQLQLQQQQQPLQQQNPLQQQQYQQPGQPGLPPQYQQPVQQPQYQPQQQQQPQQQVIKQQVTIQRQDSVPQSPKTIISVPISRDVPIQNQNQFVMPNQVNEDPRVLATADLFVQDALEYLGNQEKGNNAGAFVMEEEMLNSHDGNKKSQQYQQQQQQQHKPQSFGAEATSKQVRTNDVFDRMENDEHDDMTYAPEIQSVEIPPDQMSETSENIIDYFDKVAAESEQQIQNLQQGGTLKKSNAPQILPAFGNRNASNSSLGSGRSGSAVSSSDVYPYRHLRKQSSLLSVLGVTSMQEILLTINSLDSLSEAMRKAGLETTNLIFGIDYTASNKYQGEESFGGRSLHTIHPHVKNPYQQVITILGRTLAPFAGHGNIGVFGFGDAKTGDWSTFNLKKDGDCRDLDEVLSVYNNVTPTVQLSGPTNFAPLIYQAMETCQKSRDYHILVIIADGQVTNERATRRAIVQACQHPLSIIVVGVGDGPWDMMRIFDESLPKRPWDNFHFVEFHEIMKKTTSLEDGDVKLAVQSLLEIPDQYRCICELGLLDRSIPPRGSEIRREMMHNPL